MCIWGYVTGKKKKKDNEFINMSIAENNVEISTNNTYTHAHTYIQGDVNTHVHTYIHAHTYKTFSFTNVSTQCYSLSKGTLSHRSIWICLQPSFLKKTGSHYVALADL